MKAFKGALKRKITWKHLSENCDDRDPCECGQATLCRHSDNDGECDKDSCPIWNKSGNCSHTKI
jgi:hypothetical protein